MRVGTPTICPLLELKPNPILALIEVNSTICLDAPECWLSTAMTGISAGFLFALEQMRAPTDLQTVTRDIEHRCARASGKITDPIFPQPRDMRLELVLARHEIEAAISIAKWTWWPQGATRQPLSASLP